MPQCKSRAINAALSQNGKHLLINYEDKAIRSFDVHARDISNPKDHSLEEVEKAAGNLEVTQYLNQTCIMPSFGLCVGRGSEIIVRDNTLLNCDSSK